MKTSLRSPSRSRRDGAGGIEHDGGNVRRF